MNAAVQKCSGEVKQRQQKKRQHDGHITVRT